jgi:signal transduction histidine kinase
MELIAMTTMHHEDLEAQLAVYANDLGRLVAEHERLSASFRQLESLHRQMLDASDAERADASRNLRDALIQAESARLAKSTILANLSHELRTPLNTILGFGFIARRHGMDPAARDAVEQMERAGNRLLALLTEMLDTADIDAGKLQVEVVEFSPQNLLIGIKAHFQPMAAAKGLSLTLNLDPRVPQRLFGDPIRLGQVLRNLMGNAVKFSHEGEVVLRMGLVKLASGFADLLFEVEDSGVGIGLEAQQHLFELFEQEDASSTRCFEGAGLGLALCKLLAQLMEGNIGFNSRPGEGSLFWVTLRLPIPAQALRSDADAAPDSMKINATMTYLCNLLMQADYRALRLCIESRDLLRAALGDREADVIAAIESFDFDKALHLIEDYQSRWQRY